MSPSIRLVTVLATLVTAPGLVTLHADVSPGATWRRPLAIEGGLPLVDVWIGSSGPYRFVLDTGAEGATVSRELAVRLNLRVLGALEQHTVTGMAKAPLVEIASLTIGRDGPVMRAAAAVTDLAAMRQAVGRLDGVLGGDALNGFDYVLDYEASQLTLLAADAAQPRSPRGGVSLPLRFERHRPIVDWPVAASAGSAVPLVLDTGASALVVDEREASRFPCAARVEAVVLETHAGRRAVRACRAEPLRAGPLAVVGLQLVATPWPQGLERSDRGLIPASAFARIYVSASRKALVVWAR